MFPACDETFRFEVLPGVAGARPRPAILIAGGHRSAADGD